MICGAKAGISVSKTFDIHWKSKDVTMPTFWKLAVLMIVVTTTTCVTNEEKFASWQLSIISVLPVIYQASLMKVAMRYNPY